MDFRAFWDGSLAAGTTPSSGELLGPAIFPAKGGDHASCHILPVGSVTIPNPFEMVRFFLKHRGPTLVNSGDPPNRSDQMPPRPKPKRGMPRSLIYALIPGGFILLVIVMVFSGWVVEDEPAPMTEVREEAEEISE